MRAHGVEGVHSAEPDESVVAVSAAGAAAASVNSNTETNTTGICGIGSGKCAAFGSRNKTCAS